MVWVLVMMILVQDQQVKWVVQIQVQQDQEWVQEDKQDQVIKEKEIQILEDEQDQENLDLKVERKKVD